MRKYLLTIIILSGISCADNLLYATSDAVSSDPIAMLNTQEKPSRILWGVRASPYVRKVIVTLEEKGVPYILKEILPTKLLTATQQEIPPVFLEISPFGKIPAYQEMRGENEKPFSLTESSVIMDYLEETVKENPLRPHSPEADAQVSWFMRYGDDVLAPVTHKILFETIIKPNVLKEKTDEVVLKNMLKAELPIILDFLEKTLSNNRMWIADTKDFSLADITIVSHLATIMTSHLNLNDIIGKNRPHLLQYVKKILDRKSFNKIFA